MEDTTIIRRCLSGRMETYGILVERYSPQILNLAFAMMGDRHEAEDVAQETFVRAFRGLPRFRREARFSSWLYRIALNLCRDRLKARSRRGRSAGEEPLRGLDTGPSEQAPRRLVEGELSQKMQEAILRLPPAYRECFTLRHLQGLEYERVAEIMRITPETARVRTYRAREMLREALAPSVDTFWREKAAREKGLPPRGADEKG